MQCSFSYLYLHGGGLLVPLDHTVLGDKWSQFLSVHRLFNAHCVMVKNLREEGMGQEEKRKERKRGRERGKEGEERGEREGGKGKKRRREGERRWKEKRKKGEGNLKERDRVNRR